MFAEDGNKNLKNVIYSYNRNTSSNPPSNIVINLEPEHAVLSFASVSKVTMQKTSLVLHNANQQQNCIFNYNNSHVFPSKFELNLIDSSKGQVVCNISKYVTGSAKTLHVHVFYKPSQKHLKV